MTKLDIEKVTVSKRRFENLERIERDARALTIDWAKRSRRHETNEVKFASIYISCAANLEAILDADQHEYADAGEDMNDDAD